MESLKDEITCAICFEVYTDPILLPCQHVFCKLCIDRLKDLERQSGKNHIGCPICRVEFPLNQDFPKNFFVNNIISKLKDEKVISPDEGNKSETVVKDFVSIPSNPINIELSAPPLDDDDSSCSKFNPPHDDINSVFNPFKKSDNTKDTCKQSLSSNSNYYNKNNNNYIPNNNNNYIPTNPQQNSYYQYNYQTKEVPPPNYQQNVISPPNYQQNVISPPNYQNSVIPPPNYQQNVVPPPNYQQSIPSTSYTVQTTYSPSTSIVQNYNFPPIYCPFTIHSSDVDTYLKKWKHSLYFKSNSFISFNIQINPTPVLVPYWVFVAYCDSSVQYEDENGKTILENKINSQHRVTILAVESNHPYYHLLRRLSFDTYFYRKKGFFDTLKQLLLSEEEDIFSDINDEYLHTTHNCLVGESDTSIWNSRGKMIVKDHENDRYTKSLQLSKKTMKKPKLLSFNVTSRKQRLIYMPVYLGKYEFEGTEYLVAVNGQNGNVEGDRPSYSFCTIF